MIAIFYNNKTLKNTLVINLNNQPINHLDKYQDYVIGYDKSNSISFINIFKFNQYLNLPEGFIKPTKQIIDQVQKITKIDLSKFDLSNQIIIGHVLEVQKIDQTHLHICQVDIKKAKLQIICGASNVRAGLNVVVACVGSTLPNGIAIKKSKLMNYDSYGMLCSQKELNINRSDLNNEGIVELPSKYNVGDSFDDLYAN